VETDRTLSRKSPIIIGTRPVRVLESLSRFRLRSVRWFGWTIVKPWLFIELELSVNVAQIIRDAGGSWRERGVVGPRARRGLFSLRFLETVSASLSMFTAPTSPLTTAMMIR